MQAAVQFVNDSESPATTTTSTKPFSYYSNNSANVTCGAPALCEGITRLLSTEDALSLYSEHTNYQYDYATMEPQWETQELTDSTPDALRSNDNVPQMPEGEAYFNSTQEEDQPVYIKWIEELLAPIPAEETEIPKN